MAKAEVKEKNHSEGIKRQMEEQLAMKKRGSKERTYLMHTCDGGRGGMDGDKH